MNLLRQNTPWHEWLLRNMKRDAIGRYKEAYGSACVSRGTTEGSLPRLDVIATNPTFAINLSNGQRGMLITRAASVIAMLTVPTLAEPVGPTASILPDRWLTAVEGAAMLRRKPTWLYRNKARLPFVRQLKPGAPLLCSERGIERYLDRQRH